MGSLCELSKDLYKYSLQQNSFQDSGPQESEVTPENTLTVAKDPRYARYVKMVQVFQGWQ